MTTEAFWDRHAPKHAKKPIADASAYEQKLECVRALLGPTDRVLGIGGTARKIAPAVAHLTAADISAEMIRIARSRSDAILREKPSEPLYRRAKARLRQTDTLF